MNVETQLPSLDTIKKNEYERVDELYKLLFSELTVEHEFNTDLSKETFKILEPIPDSDKASIMEFAHRIAAHIPEEIFSDMEKIPTSRTGLKVLLAHMYNNDSVAHGDPQQRELYMRALSAMSPESLYFGHGYETNTETVAYDFFDSDFTRENFYNFLVQLNAETMPVANGSEQKRGEEKEAFDIFQEKLKQRYGKAMDVFVSYCEQFVPDMAEAAATWKDNLVFVEKVSRLHIFTNDPKLSSESSYSSLSASAVAFGIDTISGLPLAVMSRPYNYEVVATTSDILPKEDPTFKETLTLVHENIHNVTSEREFNGDYMILINELLTDTAAWAIALKSEGYDLVNCPNEYLYFTGYFDQVLFARNLAKNEFFTSDEFVDMGMHQNPQNFLDTLDKRISACEDLSKIEDTVTFMMRRFMIKPRKEEEMSATIESFRASPSAFLQKEFMDMWQLVGGQYIGQKWYLTNVFDKFREQHPDIDEKDFGAMRKENGVLVDDAVDIFYKMWGTEKRYRSLWLSETNLMQQLQEPETVAEVISTGVPERFALSGEDTETLFEVLTSVNAMLRCGLNYTSSSWSSEQKFAAILESTKAIYEGTIKILEKNWSENGISYTMDHVIRLMNEVVPAWLPYQEQVTTPQEVVAKVLDGMEALTHSTDFDEGPKILGPDQALFWGPALELKN